MPRQPKYNKQQGRGRSKFFKVLGKFTINHKSKGAQHGTYTKKKRANLEQRKTQAYKNTPCYKIVFFYGCQQLHAGQIQCYWAQLRLSFARLLFFTPKVWAASGEIINKIALSSVCNLPTTRTYTLLLLAGLLTNIIVPTLAVVCKAMFLSLSGKLSSIFTNND